MKIKELFLKPIDRTIEGVIKADDDEHLFDEIDEYVITNEIGKRLDAFLDYYNDYQGVNGVWISGFFGSGKSHLLKILSYVLENRIILDDLSAAEIFLQKLGEDPLLKGAMEKAISIPSQSILFNIDQKANVVNKDQADAVLSVFMKVFNELRGYNAKFPSIAQFEYDLERQGQLQSFKDAFAEFSPDEPWESARDAVWLESSNVARALSMIGDISEEEASKVLDRYEKTYQLSIEDFALQVKEYIDRQDFGFRLNFFVDEVGQYIADNVKLMTNLQTIAETLATKCNGQAWVIVTSQEDMDGVVGMLNKIQANDFSKIQDRFKCRMKLTSKNVSEVIQKRLLMKNTDRIQDLVDLYSRERNNFKTLFEFSDTSRSYRCFSCEDDFIDDYPFMPYQFDLLQSAIKGLSDHGALEGKHRSVGERSMLGVFQEVGKKISNEYVGVLATFDKMYEGLRTAMKSQIQVDINDAERNLSHRPLAVRVLKALLMVKYVKEFKATSRNLAILLTDRFDIDILQHEKEVQEALNILEQGTYLRRNGDIYEYLTDDEKDIENEIKNTDLDQSEVSNTLWDIIYLSIIKDNKIRYEDKGQDYPFNRLLDDVQFGHSSAELSINIITPLSSNYRFENDLITRSIRNNELVVMLGEDKRLLEDLYLLNKTEKYCRIHQSAGEKGNIRRILSEKARLNQELRKDLEVRIRETISNASLYVKGEKIEVNLIDPKLRICKGFERLISSVYPNLRMLDASYNEDRLRTILTVREGDILLGKSESEAESEMFNTFIQRNSGDGIRTTVKSLLEHFSSNSYGWWQFGTLCVLAKLYVRGKVEIKQDSNFLERDAVLSNLRNSHLHSNTIIEPKASFPEHIVRNLKKLHQDLFNEPNHASDAKGVALFFKSRLKTEVQNLESMLITAGGYPFASDLEKAKSKLIRFTDKDYTFYLSELKEFEDEILDIQETIVDPIKHFLNGSKKGIFDSIKQFMVDNEANSSYLDASILEQLRESMRSNDIYKNTNIQEAKKLCETLQEELDHILQEERSKTAREMDALLDTLRSLEGYAKLTPDQVQDLERPFNEVIRSLCEIRFVFRIREEKDRIKNEVYPSFIARARQMINSPSRVGEGSAKEKFIPIDHVKRRKTKTYLETDADVQEYLNAYKEELMKHIINGEKIVL
ncbi:MAG: BREX system P-loop protein BrxC [Aminobacterium colombiense]|jgi:hypothetical protein|uniref:BREX system P-loop protein BrxC n=1 Tax=Aminobacterium colombiense TaxID=81468 RepID=UPI003D964CE5